MHPKKNQLINLCMPFIDTVRDLRTESGSELPADLGDSLYQCMKALEHQGFEKQIPGHITTDMQYALAALVDEVIMMSSWPGKANWMDRSLQCRLFGEHLAGVNFFQRLERIRQGGEPNLALLEVYYVCLQLGFQGKFALSQQEELKSMQVDIKNQIDLYKGTLSPTLSCDLETTTDRPSSSKNRIQPWMILATGAVVITLLYAVYGFRIFKLEKKHAPLVETVRSERS
jgi:type VI secretion system protein ImpK